MSFTTLIFNFLHGELPRCFESFSKILHKIKIRIRFEIEATCKFGERKQSGLILILQSRPSMEHTLVWNPKQSFAYHYHYYHYHYYRSLDGSCLCPRHRTGVKGSISYKRGDRSGIDIFSCGLSFLYKCINLMKWIRLFICFKFPVLFSLMEPYEGHWYSVLVNICCNNKRN